MTLSTTQRVLAGSLAALTVTGLAAGTAQADTLATDLVPVEQNVVANVAAAGNTVNYTVNIDQTRATMWLNQYRELRGKMWDLNPPFTEVLGQPAPLQTVAAKYGLDTKEKYMNAVQWDLTLEQEAIQRAAEASIYTSHDRPDGSSSDAVIVPGNPADRSENLAWGARPNQAFDAWSTLPIVGGQSEYDWLIASNGYFNSGNGHLWTILDPTIQSFGVSHATNVNGANHTTAMRLARGATTNTGMTGTVGQFVMNQVVDPAVFNHFKVADLPALEAGAQTTARIIANGAPNALWHAMYMLTPAGSWSVSNPSVASIDPATGVITGLSGGETQVIFTTAAGDVGYAASLTVNGAAVDPVTPEQPEVPAEPVVPEQPVEPVTPEVPVEPVTPEKPEVPVEPVVPEQPEVPVEPVTPEQPTEPVVPVTPEQPVEPVTPEVPVEPEQPVEPVTPEQPVEPTEPITPEVPVEPVVPEQPIVPEQPVEPVTPEQPTEPVAPEVPEQPVTPEVPAVPEQPVEPVEPVVPEQPVTPEVPVAPNQPEQPVTPDQPKIPAEPEAPSTPEAPVVSEPVRDTVDYTDPGTAPIKAIGDQQGQVLTEQEIKESAEKGAVNDQDAQKAEEKASEQKANEKAEGKKPTEEKREELAETGADANALIAGTLALALGSALVAARRRRTAE